MKKHIALVSFAVLFLIGFSGTVSTQEETATIAPEETVTIEDLGISDAGVLPTSPFYFFKEMSRNVQSFFTFNPVSKTELQLKIVNEKAAEAKKIIETQPQNTEAVQKALENYQATQKKLLARFEKLEETSQNPNIDKLLDNLTDRMIKHEKLFDEIAFKFGEKERITEVLNQNKKGSEELVGEASKKDEPAKFASRLENVLLKERGGDLKNIRAVEIIDRLSDKTTATTKESLERLREEFSEKSEMDIENLVINAGEDALKEKIANTPGDFAKRSVIIEEIQKRTGEQLALTLGKALGQIEGIIQKETDLAPKAEEQITRARKIIEEVEKKISESTTTKIDTVVSTLLTEAKDHLKNAESALAEEKYGEAFGQARSAEVLARNALKFFGEAKPEAQNFERQLKGLEEKIRLYKKLIEERELTEEQKENAYEILNNNAVMQLEQAKESLKNGNLEEVKKYIDYIKKTFLKLSNILERKTTSAAPVTETVRTAIPIETKPVTSAAVSCEYIQKKIIELKSLLATGKITEPDFKTRYDASLRNLIVCQEEKNAQTPTIQPAPEKPTTLPTPSTQTVCTLEYAPVCGANGKTYSNTCFAKAAGITVLYRGKCQSESEEESGTGTIKPLEQNQTIQTSPSQ